MLSALFHEEVYVSDTQLGDNPHILADFFRRDTHGLLGLLEDLARNRVLRVLLRDSYVLASGKRVLECGTFEDVYTAWLAQNMPSAWVTTTRNDERRQYYKRWDDLITGADVAVRYPYVSVKRDFMQRVQSAHLIGRTGGELPADLVKAYEQILRRDWFSHSELFGLLAKSGTSAAARNLRRSLAIYDSVCYADLCAADLATTAMDPYVALGQERPAGGLRQTLDQVIDHVLETVELPALSALAELNADDIASLRLVGRKLFEQVNYSSLLTDDERRSIQRQFGATLVEYWQQVCEHLVRTHPGAAMERTTLGLFAAEQLPTIGRIYHHAVSLGLSFGLSLIPLKTLRSLAVENRESLRSLLDLRFITMHESGGLRQLRRSLPPKSWMSSLALERISTRQRGAR